MPCGGSDSQAAERKAEWTSAGQSAWAAFRENSSDKRPLVSHTTMGLPNHSFINLFIHYFLRTPSRPLVGTRTVVKKKKKERQGPYSRELMNSRLGNKGEKLPVTAE